MRAPLPGAGTQLSMAPGVPIDATTLHVGGKSCHEAGVLVPIFPMEDTLTIVFTVRCQDLSHHGGQISFPGGRLEAHDQDLRDTALREAHEEIDLPPEDVEILGALTPLYVPPSNFCVHPFVGVIRHHPELRPEDKEVDEILRIPLSRLMDPAAMRCAPQQLFGEEVLVPYFEVNGYKIWGATAMMLAELITLFEELPLRA